jgi:hypothetical protein
LSIDPDCPPESREAIQRLLGLLGIPGESTTRPSGVSSPGPEPSLHALAAWVREHLLSNSTGQATRPALSGSPAVAANDLQTRARMVRDQAQAAARCLQEAIRDLDALLSPPSTTSQPATLGP